MRQGPDYSMWVSRSKAEGAFLWLPLELEDEWRNYTVVTWHDNGDGTYTLTPREKS